MNIPYHRPVLSSYRCLSLQRNKCKSSSRWTGADEIFRVHRYIHWFLQELLDENKFSEFNIKKDIAEEPRTLMGLKNYCGEFPAVSKANLNIDRR